MTIRELHDQLTKLIDNGYGACLAIKSCDDEGNDFDEISSVEVSKSKSYNKTIELVHPDDEDEYDNLNEVVCFW